MNFITDSVKIFLKQIQSCITCDQWALRSWSQEGEDQILHRIFERQSSGFYVDVGAHHPKRFSNTYLFYRRGWRGINIDAMPGSMTAFRKSRPRDINLELGVWEKECRLNYYVFNEPALNGFSGELSQERHSANSAYQINEVIELDVLPLRLVLERHLPQGQNIDFMSVDVEGLDLEVLNSNDWAKYRPRFVLAEILGSSLHEIEKCEIGELMRGVGYFPYAKSMNTVFYKDSVGPDHRSVQPR